MVRAVNAVLARFRPSFRHDRREGKVHEEERCCRRGRDHGPRHAAPAFADAGAEGAAVGSPGVLSGNVIQVPVHVPVNVCGNSINVVGLLNPAFGNKCEND